MILTKTLILNIDHVEGWHWTIVSVKCEALDLELCY